MADLLSIETSMTAALVQALEGADLSSEDGALRRLAETYARELDSAAAVARAADRILRAARASGDEDLAADVAALRQRLTARVALENLGPRFLAALAELGMSPAARAKHAKARPGAPSPAATALQALRAVPGA